LDQHSVGIKAGNVSCRARSLVKILHNAAWPPARRNCCLRANRRGQTGGWYWQTPHVTERPPPSRQALTTPANVAPEHARGQH